MPSRPKAALLLIGVAVLIAIIALAMKPFAQPLSYHNFADQRSWLGIPNFGDVSSSLPFAIIGLWGLVALFAPGAIKFADSRERWPYVVMFSGLVLTALGSAYYHLAPNNARLVWDRLPINIVIMALLAAVVAERVGVTAGLALFPFFEAAGIASVLTWYASELQGHGDLRFYAAVQIYAVLALLLSPLLRSNYTRRADFAVVVGFYALAKFLEEYDRKVFALGHVVSGHTLKHLAAAGAGYWILRMLETRKFAGQSIP